MKPREPQTSKKSSVKREHGKVSAAGGCGCGGESATLGLPCPRRIMEEGFRIWGMGDTQAAAEATVDRVLAQFIEQKKKQFVCDGYDCGESGQCRFDYVATSEKVSKQYTTKLNQVTYWKCTQTFDFLCVCVYIF